MGEEENYRELVDKYISIYRSKVAPILKNQDETRKFMVFLSSLNTFLEENKLGRIIIVGGFAAEIYTGRGYRTADVDIIVEGNFAEKFVCEVLERIGYVREARVYIQDFGELVEKAIDIVGTMYDRPMKPIKWKISIDNFYVYIIPPEEIIISSLASAKFWNVGIDFERAAMIYYAQKDNIDHSYLIKRAREENVEDTLNEIFKLCS